MTLLKSGDVGRLVTQSTVTSTNKVLTLDDNNNLVQSAVDTLQEGMDSLDTLEGVIPGTSAPNKAVVLDASSKIDALDITALTLNGTTVDASATEINVLDGVVAGTSAANKAVILDGSSKIDALDITALSLNGAALGASATEIDVLDGVTAGTSAANKAIVLDGSSKIDAIDITALTLNGTAVDATAAQINTKTINTVLDNLSVASSAFVACPYAGTITSIQVVIDKLFATADATLTFTINGVAITNSTIVIPFITPPLAGDVASSTPTAANTVAIGDSIKITTDGAPTNVVRVVVTYTITL